MVGLSVVSLGASAPEVAVSIGAALDGLPDLAVGNVVGSNIFNVLFILGISALIVPLTVHAQLMLVRQSRRESKETQDEFSDELPAETQWDKHWAMQILLIAAGLGLLVLGSNWLVDAAITVAKSLGVSDLVIGLTIVAAGTSMPELATSIMAAIRGQRDNAIG